MVSAFLLVVSTVLTLAAPARARAEGWTRETNFIFGQKVLDESDWQPVENHDLFGVEVSWGKRAGRSRLPPISAPTKKTDEPYCENIRIWSGCSKDLGPPACPPLFWGGAVIVYGAAELDFSGIIVKDSDISTGSWAGGGCFLAPRVDSDLEALEPSNR